MLVKPASLELIQLGHNKLRFSLYKLIQVSNEKYGLAIRFKDWVINWLTKDNRFRQRHGLK